MARREILGARRDAPSARHRYALFMQKLLDGEIAAVSLDDGEIYQKKIVYEDGGRVPPNPRNQSK